MSKRHKLLSLILSSGIVASAFPNSGTGATSDSISFYNAKKSILDMKKYDEAYDTNHDGVVNVFDVIRENKEVFQEESYTDLKSKIYSLETQIEILTQKLSEKEEKAQVESNLSEINSVLSGKVDIQEGKQLSTNDYTDEEKKKLERLNNYDDTLIKNNVSELSESIAEKVNKEEGKLLSSNDYTDEDKNKLATLECYNDNDIKSAISSINSELSSISDAVSGKADQQEGKQLSSNDYTDSDKKKLESLENYDDTKINEKIDSLVKIAYDEKNQVEASIENKVEKEEGKQLSSNDFTDEEKNKLENLNNYDDTHLKNEIEDIKNDLSLIYKDLNSINHYYILVSKYGKGDFITINSALEYAYSIESEDSPVTILVDNGVYNESCIVSSNHFVSIVGLNRNECIIRDDTGIYDNCPLRIEGNSYVANLTLISTHKNTSDFVTDGIVQKLPSYALHIDDRHADDDKDYKCTIENCYIYSEQNPAVGIGLDKNQIVELINCEMISNISDDILNANGMLADNWAWKPNGGALFYHSLYSGSYISDEGYQKLVVKNCVMRNRSKNIICGEGGGMENQVTLEFINNVGWSDINGATYLNGLINSKLSPLSYGNNCDEMNFKN